CAQLTEGALWKLRSHEGLARSLRGSLFRPQMDGETTTRVIENALSASVLPQELPPVNLIFVHRNSQGQMGLARLYHVIFTDQSEVKGANNRFTEEPLQYQALFYEQLRLHRSLTVDEMVALVGRSGAAPG